MNYFLENWPLILILIISIVFILKFNTKTSDVEFGVKSTDLISLNNNGSAIIVDIRSQADFSNAYIIGSVNSTNNIDDIKSIITKNKRKTVVVVCETGKSAAHLVQKLINIKNSYNIKFLIGGIANWKAEGLPVLNK